MSLFLKTLIVAGGGGGGGGGNGGTTHDQNGGGGGGGGYIYDDAVSVIAGSYAIIVGDGGVQSTARDTNGGDGENSSAFGLLAIGGGGGGSGEMPGDTVNSSPGRNGGSGGGAGGNENDSDKPGGTGITGQGFDGGVSNGTVNKGYGGGGGGAGAVGGNATSTNGGNGGNGVANSISGASVVYGGGGGGQQANGGTNLYGVGGSGGGGNGGGVNRFSNNPQNGTDGLGGGGGGGSRGSSSSSNYSPLGGSGRGGKGVVIIRYVTAEFGVCTGGVKTTDGADTVHTFLSDGTFVLNVLPDAQTYATTTITKTTATPHGEIVSDGGETIVEMGFVYNTSPNPTISDTKVLVTNGVGPYLANLTGLTPNTEYFLKAFITVASGTYYGDEEIFTTLPPITINTFEATDITQTTALANGEVVDDDGHAITERGFVWALTINPNTGDDKIIVAGTIGSYSGLMESLTPGTLYYVRAYAINSEGTSYGENRSFTTMSNMSRVGTLDTGFTDYDEPIYFEIIDRWRSFTDIYAEVKSISGLNIYNQNGAGANITYQTEDAGPNNWQDIGSVDEDNNSLFPNASTNDFNVIRLRIAGFTKGTNIVFHGIELLSINLKGLNKN